MGDGAGVGASRVCGRVRFQQAGEAARNRDQDGVDQSARLDSLDVKNADGTVTSWMVEGGSPNTLLRNGFTKASLPVGTEIVVDGYQSKDEIQQNERPRHHVPGWTQTLCRIGRAAAPTSRRK